MQQIVPVYEDPELSPEQKSDAAMVEGMLVLGGTIRLSEKGFDRDDAAQLDTFEVVTEWNQLMIALDRLEKLLEE